MKKGLMILLLIVDAVFMPLRAILGLIMVITASCIADQDIKTAVDEYWQQLKNYPEYFKLSIDYILNKD